MLMDTILPRMIPVEQHFARKRVGHIPEAIQQQFALEDIHRKIGSGMKVAVAVGSRGIADLQQVVAAVIAMIKYYGGKPFIVPAMGSHGGASAEGQIEILAEYGITEAEVGAPVVSSMDTVEVGTTSGGIPLYFDRHAFEADAVVMVGRIKAHTDFKGSVESGLLKMAAIGLGKHKGAAALHSQGFDSFAALIPEAGAILLAKTPIVLGVAILENAYDEIADIQILTSEEIAAKEPELLAIAKTYMPRIHLDKIDVLIIDEIGKNISGAGMDPNITGRFGGPIHHPVEAPSIQKVFVRDLTYQSHGNATGIGLADITTRRLVDKIDFNKTYTNCITSTVLTGAKIPVTMPADRDALNIAIQTCNKIVPGNVKIVWIKNTLFLQHIYISDTYDEALSGCSTLSVMGDAIPFEFDELGNLAVPPLFVEHS
ncbi:nickel pincer cofactor-dependent isomerase, group 22 [Paenibacillus baimaensis]|nr:DUF362 domain-containing protein [Paenibacillus sp. WQ 127069]